MYMRFAFDKLVRDLVVPGSASEGCRPKFRTLVGDELEARLRAKVREEAEEVASATSREEMVKEMGDLLEVQMMLMARHGITAEDVEAARLAKRAKKGGFETATLIEFNDIPLDHFELQDFLDQPEKYPCLGEVA